MKRLGWGFLIFVSVLLLAALAANVFMAMRVGGRLNAAQAAIRAAGDPASIADLRPKPIPAADNAAARLAALAPLLDAFGRDHQRFLSKTELGKAFDESDDRREPMTAEQAEAIRVILDNHAALARELEAAATLDAWASQLNFSLNHTAFINKMLEPLQAFRTAARMIDWQMRLSVHDGKLDQGVAQGIALLRLARLHESEPTLVNYLVTIAARGVALRRLYDVLAAGPVSPEMHAALEAELARADNPQSFVNMLKTERAVVIEAIETGLLPAAPGVLTKAFGWVVQRQFLGSLELMDDVIADSAKRWKDFRQAAKSGGALQPYNKYGNLAATLAPAVNAAVQARERDLTQIRALRAFNALGAFADETGREPTGLADVTLAAGAAEDPATGKPLVLKRTDQGWLIYGVGQNGKDDGGRIEGAMEDYGLGPARGVRAGK